MIDDAPAIHRLLAFKLKHEGIEILAAFDGAEGLGLAISTRPSLVLLDLAMPGMDGYAVLRALKDDPRTMDIPVIIVSGSTRPEDKVKAFELGAMDFVTKPFDIHELRARINSAIKLHNLRQMLEKRAQIDGLTGLWNRVYFNDRLTSELDSAARNKSAVSLIMCDLDHFKKINDTFGHPAGDAVLIGYSKLLTTEMRSYDVACRYGGEEFAVILPDASREQALRICERLRTLIEAKRWPNYPEIRITSSFGVTTRPAAGLEGPPGWIEAADRALYAAKTSGRNRVVVYDPQTHAAKEAAGAAASHAA